MAKLHKIDNGPCTEERAVRCPYCNRIVSKSEPEIIAYRCSICKSLVGPNQVIDGGGPPLGKDWSIEFGKAIAITHYDPNKMMFLTETSIYKGQTHYYKAEPKKYCGQAGITYGDNNPLPANMRFGLRDDSQGTTINVTYPMVYKLNPIGLQVGDPITMTGSGEFSVTVKNILSLDEYNAGYKFLIVVTEKGLGGETGVTISWRFVY